MEFLVGLSLAGKMSKPVLHVQPQTQTTFHDQLNVKVRSFSNAVRWHKLVSLVNLIFVKAVVMEIYFQHQIIALVPPFPGEKWSVGGWGVASISE